MEELQQLFPNYNRGFLEDILSQSAQNLEVAADMILKKNTESLDNELVRHIADQKQQKDIMDKLNKNMSKKNKRELPNADVAIQDRKVLSTRIYSALFRSGTKKLDPSMKYRLMDDYKNER